MILDTFKTEQYGKISTQITSRNFPILLLYEVSIFTRYEIKRNFMKTVSERFSSLTLLCSARGTFLRTLYNIPRYCFWNWSYPNIEHTTALYLYFLSRKFSSLYTGTEISPIMFSAFVRILYVHMFRGVDFKFFGQTVDFDPLTICRGKKHLRQNKGKVCPCFENKTEKNHRPLAKLNSEGFRIGTRNNEQHAHFFCLLFDLTNPQWSYVDPEIWDVKHSILARGCRLSPSFSGKTRAIIPFLDRVLFAQRACSGT